MIKKPVTIKHQNGLDVRPIALLVQEASQYSSRIYIEVNNRKINAKSIMGMMSLNLGEGEEVTVAAEGEDELDAVAGVEQFLSNQKSKNQNKEFRFRGSLWMPEIVRREWI